MIAKHTPWHDGAFTYAMLLERFHLSGFVIPVELCDCFVVPLVLSTRVDSLQLRWHQA